MRRAMVSMVLGFAAAAGVVGCASSGLSYREAQTGGQSRYLNTLYADANVAAVKPQPFRRPAGLAVAQIGEVAPPQVMLDQLREQPRLFRHVEAIPAVQDDRIYYAYDNKTQPPPDPTRRHINAMRGMAATMGMDYLLLVGGTVDQSSENTELSVLNLTIVGAFLLPGEQTQALVKASGAVIDVRTGQVVSISTAEVSGEVSTPSLAGGNKRIALLKKLRDDVTADLAKNVARDVERLTSSRAY